MQIYDIPIDENGRESTELGTREFPLMIYKTVLSKNVKGFVDWHWHDAFQFCLVTKGSIEVHVNNNKFILSEGEGCFINIGFLHMIRAVDDPDSTYICINAHQKLLYGYSGNIVQQRYVAPYIEKENRISYAVFSGDGYDERIRRLMRSIFDVSEKKDPGFEIEIIASLLIIWKDLISKERETAAGYDHNRIGEPRMNDAIRYLQGHYSEKFSLSELAKVMHLSESECSRFFKRHMGITISEYLLSYRIEQSFDMLRLTDLSVSEVAYECGFSSTSYFIDKFRKYVGVTPLRYRKLQAD